MSLSAKLQPHFNSTPLSHQFLLQRFNCFSKRKCSTLFMHNHLFNNTNLFLTLRTKPCSSNTNDNAYELSDSTSHEGSAESEESKKGDSLSINEIMKKLKRYGVSGILSYGLLNTAYYLTTFLFVWFYIAPAPGKMGYLAAVERALALAPIVDRGLSWFTNKFMFQSQGKAFMAIVGFCFGLALIVFLVITLLWA